ncbi:MAG: 16S rRNA (cytidine(1402)-2'-O)-methyltransferase [bacterium]|nr:16S rRNA (cytidine(1402)-2'-O)-methyltransferase [bacterium]
MSKLFVISRDIGNPSDVSPRVVNALRECSFVLCEDTRVAGIFLKNHAVEKKELISLNEFNERRKTPWVLDRIREGESAGLISDAGTPSVSDPGYYVVSQAILAGIQIVPVPGVSAVMTALVGAGFPTDAFAFYGFLPKKEKKRREKLAEAMFRAETSIFFESPHRIDKTLEDIASIDEERSIVIARELTKTHEEFVRGTALSLLKESWVRKGEMVLLIKGEGKCSAAKSKTVSED